MWQAPVMQVHGRNNNMVRLNTRGVFATPATRAPRDVRGKTLPVHPCLRRGCCEVSSNGRASPRMLDGGAVLHC